MHYSANSINIYEHSMAGAANGAVNGKCLTKFASKNYKAQLITIWRAKFVQSGSIVGGAAGQLDPLPTDDDYGARSSSAGI